MNESIGRNSSHPVGTTRAIAPSPGDDACVFVIVEESWRRAILADQLAGMRLRAEYFAGVEAFRREFDPRRAGCLIFDAPSATGGLELLQRRDALIPPSIIYITADTDAAVVVQVMKQGAIDFLPRRTYNDAELWDAIRRALHRDAEGRLAAEEFRLRKARFDSLGQADRDVLRRLMLGYSNAAVAAALNITESAAEGRRIRLMKKLDVQNFPALIRLIIESGFEDDL